MSKIVVLAGSVRRGGNTEVLVKSFVDGASKNNDVEVISVADYKVKPCIGCNSCFEREGNLCFQKDDMDSVYKKLSQADTIVIASPVYFYGISAQLKAIIDRLHTPLRNTFKVKKLALLLVAGADSPTVFEAIKLQYKLVLDFFKLQDTGKVLVSGVREMGAIERNKALDEAYKLGLKV